MTPEPAAVGAPRPPQPLPQPLPEDGETTARLKGLAGVSQDDLFEAVDLFLSPKQRPSISARFPSRRSSAPPDAAEDRAARVAWAQQKKYK